MKDMNHFGVYNEEMLFFTVGGSFASDAWITGDQEKYDSVLDTKFSAYTADDGKPYNLARHLIRRVTSQEEFDTLFAKSCENFKFIIDVADIPVNTCQQEFDKIVFMGAGYDLVKETMQALDYQDTLNKIKEDLNA